MTVNRINCLLTCPLLCLMPFILQAQDVNLPPSQSSLPEQSMPLQAEAPLMSKLPEAAPTGMMQTALPERAQQILDFWFGPLPSPIFFPVEKISTWFANSPDSDWQIRENFSQDIVKAMRGELNSWRETPRGRLALIVLLDQFPRHIYRNQPQAFTADSMARGLVIEGLQKGDDKRLYPVERAFFYLPLEHTEDLAMQNLSVELYQQLLAQSSVMIRPQMQEFLRFAILHWQHIIQFGRFPHRNAILGRESTPEEVVFLTQWKRSFY